MSHPPYIVLSITTVEIARDVGIAASAVAADATTCLMDLPYVHIVHIVKGMVSR